MTIEEALRIAEHGCADDELSTVLAWELRKLQTDLHHTEADLASMAADLDEAKAEVNRVQIVNDGLHIDLAESAATLHEVKGECDRAMKSARERFAELHATQDERDALASDLAVVKAARDSATQELMKEYKTRCLVQKEFDRLAIMLPCDLPVISAQRDTLTAERDALQVQLHDMGALISKVMSSATYTMLRHLYHPEETV